MKTGIFSLVFLLSLQAIQFSEILVDRHLPRRYYIVTKGEAVKNSSHQREWPLKAAMKQNHFFVKLFHFA